MSAAPQSDNLASVLLGRGDDMGRRRGQRKGYLRPENGNWLLTYRVYTKESGCEAMNDYDSCPKHD